MRFYRMTARQIAVLAEQGYTYAGIPSQATVGFNIPGGTRDPDLLTVLNALAHDGLNLDTELVLVDKPPVPLNDEDDYYAAIPFWLLQKVITLVNVLQDLNDTHLQAQIERLMPRFRDEMLALDERYAALKQIEDHSMLLHPDPQDVEEQAWTYDSAAATDGL